MLPMLMVVIGETTSVFVVEIDDLLNFKAVNKLFTLSLWVRKLKCYLLKFNFKIPWRYFCTFVHINALFG